jgi:hypothetical protein
MSPCTAYVISVGESTFCVGSMRVRQIRGPLGVVCPNGIGQSAHVKGVVGADVAVSSPPLGRHLVGQTEPNVGPPIGPHRNPSLYPRDDEVVPTFQSKEPC